MKASRGRLYLTELGGYIRKHDDDDDLGDGGAGKAAGVAPGTRAKEAPPIVVIGSGDVQKPAAVFATSYYRLQPSVPSSHSLQHLLRLLQRVLLALDEVINVCVSRAIY